MVNHSIFASIRLLFSNMMELDQMSSQVTNNSDSVIFRVRLIGKRKPYKDFKVIREVRKILKNDISQAMDRTVQFSIG